MVLRSRQSESVGLGGGALLYGMTPLHISQFVAEFTLRLSQS